jgi:hypothetical protein
MGRKRRLTGIRCLGNRQEYRGSPHEVKIEDAITSSFFGGFSSLDSDAVLARQSRVTEGARMNRINELRRKKKMMKKVVIRREEMKRDLL